MVTSMHIKVVGLSHCNALQLVYHNVRVDWNAWIDFIQLENHTHTHTHTLTLKFNSLSAVFSLSAQHKK